MKTEELRPNIELKYKKIGSIELPMQVFLPEEKNKTNIPIICIHGGGWKTDIKADTEWNGGFLKDQAIHFANKGYVGINISYRSIDMTEKTDVFDLIEDCSDAIKYVKENFDFIDKNKIILFGESAGGHLASYLGITDDDEIRPYMVIACNPVLDCTRERWHYSAKDEKKRLLASPLKKEIKKSADFLFLHGTNDTVANPEDTIELHNKLLEKGFNSELIMIDGAVHAFILRGYESSDEEVFKYREKIDSYLKKHQNLKVNK